MHDQAQLKHTSGNSTSIQVVELYDWTVRELCVFFACNNCHALAAKHKPFILLLQQHEDVFEQNHVQVNLLRATDTPRQWTFIQHLMLRQVKTLQMYHRNFLVLGQTAALSIDMYGVYQMGLQTYVLHLCAQIIRHSIRT